MKLYSVYNKVENLYNQPFYEKNKIMAIRRYEFWIKKAELFTDEDMALYVIGEWDEKTGVIKAYENKQLITEERA